METQTSNNSITLDIKGMTCASCVRRVERALGKVEGVDLANVNFASEQARVTLAGEVPVEHLVAAVEKAGYGAAEAIPGHQAHDHSGRTTLAALVFGIVLGVPTIILAMAMDIADLTLAGNHRLTGWFLLALATPIQVVLGWRFYKGSWTSLRHLNPNMDVLVALGTTVAYFYSAWVVIEGSGRHMYFDVSAAVLVFITLGKYLEERSKGAAGAAVRALLNLTAKTATVLRDANEVEIPAEDLMPGDILLIRPGERIPADGVVREGITTIDESMLTGESIPMERGPGQQVMAGTINTSGLVRVEATAVGRHSTLARLAEMVQEAQGSRAPIERVVDRVAAIFVPIVIVLAVSAFVAWGLVANDWSEGMVAAVAVLVVACPCALGLATPTAIMVGTGIGAERGILIRNAEVLERIRKLDAVILDKTGTLTEGRPEVVEIVPIAGFDRTTLLSLVAAAESGSEHPLSRAIVDAAVEGEVPLPGAQNFQSHTARGVSATVLDRQVIAGNVRLLEERDIDLGAGVLSLVDRLEAEGRTVILAAIDGLVAGAFAISDAVKPGAARAVASLKALGLRVIMLTGDNERAAASVARAVSIDEFHARVRPEDKLDFVRGLQTQGLSVAMVGDGINDAPALAAADISIAMSTGTDVAIAAGDITLLHGDVSRITEAILLGRSTLTTIRQNLVWAFGYNVVAIPIAMAALLNPILAGGAMAFSSVSVMANSLRLRAKARRIAESSGNPYTRPAQGFLAANRLPVASLAGVVLVLAVPFTVFTAIDRDWLGNDSATAPRGHIEVQLRNWSVDVSSHSIAAGTVTFEAVHPEAGHDHSGGDAGALHDLVVLRRDENGDYEAIARTAELAAGERESLTLRLNPGTYELVCDLVEQFDGRTISHTNEGMRTTLTVTAS